jgi:hypothetical protein
MQVVITVMGKRFAVDETTLYNFLRSAGQSLDAPQQVREVTNQNYDERVLIKG